MSIIKWHLPNRLFRAKGGPDFFDVEARVRELADEQIADGGVAAPLASPTFTGTVTVPTPLNISTIKILVGAGTPEGAVTAVVGSLFLRTDGSTSTTLYVKTSGSGNTGWTAK